jgi:hypothetical protein
MPWAQFIVLVLVILFAITGYFIWDRQYRGDKGENLQRTDEVFKDPTTGKLTRVYEDPATGKRQYREEP